MMYLARELGKSLEELMEMSTVEFVYWAAFFQLEKKETDKRMKNGNQHRR